MTTPPTPPAAPEEARKPASWVRRHKILSGIGAAAVLFGIIGVFADSGDNGDNTATGSSATTSPPVAAPAHQPAKAPSAAAKPAEAAEPASSERIVFSVTGRAPQGVDVTYGSDSDSRSGNTRTGANGMPTAKLPFEGSLRVDEDVAYYMLNAQLGGAGDITCKLIVGGKTIAKGHASGDYNICSAQASPGLFGGWTSY
jgi:hypothetical protein